MNTKRIFSGVQPTGGLHLGNYLGAVKRFAALQDGAESPPLFCIVDQHAITMLQDPAELRQNTRVVAAAFLAAGIDPNRSIIFNQSRVLAHTELAWILSCTARVGWLERMTQFKDKAGENAERESVGLYAYPVLMAADILLYKATHVPVGADQKQHLELTRDIAQRFNKDHKDEIAKFTGREYLFPKPTPLIETGVTTRVMSFQDATKKMSKSDPNGMATIHMMDTADEIARKVKRAQSDAGTLPGREEDLADRPAARNLVGVYAALSEQSVQDVLTGFEGRGFSDLKKSLTDILVFKLVPIGDRMRALLDDGDEIDSILRFGALNAAAIAAKTMIEVREIVGFL